MRYPFIMLLATLALSPSAQAAHASFKCNAHSSPVEKRICTDDELAQLDASLASLYHVLLKSLSDEEQSTLRDEQRDWLESRNACDKAADIRACIKAEYHARISELKDR
ncbi:lysozyme inhibitor LprI family protein [Thiocystis violacea]|uniref:lysozyme inhibitor LprI family protein n=1 Tax=Thiocystis violacea TaxID=13725 RepID=UPI001906B12E|nr:lysozyme inhibitor LprI family protein [Thiocystis violacea]MBK1718954.1 hypothetical protein [Thiocystis violacea]